jgi:Na+-transporting NADH:ubiquinone oxidoreductase subunit F
MRDYSLTGPESGRAAERGLVDGEWFRSPVDPDRMCELTERTNARAMVDLAVWIALIIATGAAAVWSIGDWWAVPLFALYGAVTAGAADARWHEFGHGTAARSSRLNDSAYWFASFLLWRSPTAWRWSHFRHHTDTIIVGRDPEIQLGRPARMTKFVLNYTNLVNGPKALWLLIRYAAGRLDADTLDFVPVDEQPKVVRESRVFVAILTAVAVLSAATSSWTPALLVGLPTIYGAWLMVFFGATQHLGLGEDVLDHRYSTRTVYVNPVFRFLYLNMNYHVEHHMFPAVPYYRLPDLHAEIKHTLPAPSPSMFHAYREIVAALWKQRTDPAYTPRDRIVPDIAPAQGRHGRLGAVRPDGSFDLGPLGLVEVGSISRVDVSDHTFAVARLDADRVCVVDGYCTHGRAHLADGVIVESADGASIECPKHNGRFDLASGAPCRKPVTVAIEVHAVDIKSGHVIIPLPDTLPDRLGDRTAQEHLT